jgi:DNA polymerase/3'-5' exonuclease PolX
MSNSSASSAIKDYKEAILDALRTHRDYQTTQTDGAFRVRAYNKVMSGIHSLATVHRMEDLEGIVPASKSSEIRKKVAEVLATGSLASAEVLKADPTKDILKLFQGIYGIGAVRAKQLVELGMNNLEDLRKHPELLNEKQTIGLKYYEPLRERILRAEMVIHESLLLSNLSTGITGSLAGSFRRGKESSGDIDLLLRGGDASHLNRLVIHLTTTGYILETLAHGDKKFMGICCLEGNIPRRIDILVTTAEEFPYALLTFTGSDKFNVLVRAHAKTLGYSLNEYRLSLTAEGAAAGRALPASPLLTEEAILAFLGLTYVKPEDRTETVKLEML